MVRITFNKLGASRSVDSSLLFLSKKIVGLARVFLSLFFLDGRMVL